MKQSFTLLELLGLVFVVALVAFIFMPCAFHGGHSREKARRSQCRNNLKQIGLAMVGYSEDYGGAFPLTPTGNNFEILDEKHTNILPSSKVYGCPSSDRLSTVAAHSNYWYIGSGVRDDVTEVERVMLAYDAFGNHPKNAWMNVLYADAHVGGGRPDPKRGLYDNRHAIVKEDESK